MWNPDGSQMAATDNVRGLVEVFDPRVPWNQQTPQPLPPHPSGRAFWALSWSSDGTQLAGELQPITVGGIATYNFQSRTYTDLSDVGTFPVWLKDSDHLIFLWQGKLFLVDHAKQVQELKLLSVAPDQIGNFSLSRDNRQMAFDRLVSEADIWLATLK